MPSNFAHSALVHSNLKLAVVAIIIAAIPSYCHLPLGFESQRIQANLKLRHASPCSGVGLTQLLPCPCCSLSICLGKWRSSWTASVHCRCRKPTSLSHDSSEMESTLAIFLSNCRHHGSLQGLAFGRKLESIFEPMDLAEMLLASLVGSGDVSRPTYTLSLY